MTNNIKKWELQSFLKLFHQLVVIQMVQEVKVAIQEDQVVILKITLTNDNSNNNKHHVEVKMHSFKKWENVSMITLPLYKDLLKIQFQKQLDISLWRNHKKYYNLSFTTK